MMSRRYGYLFRHLKKSFMPRKDFHELSIVLKSTLKKIVPPMVDKRVNEIAKKIVPLYVVEGLLLDKQKTQTDMATMIVGAVQKERETLRAELSMQVTNVVTNVVPSQDDEQVCNANLSIWWSLKIKFEKPAPHDDDARPEGESSAKRQRTSEHGTYLVDDDEVPFEEVSPKLLEEISGEVDEAQL
ncbi:hypothetical protein Tco_0157506 [Tanacetum coccineum]